MKSKLPDEWKEYRIREIGTVVTGNTPPKKYPENYGGSLPWIKPPDLDKEMYVSNSEETISDIGMKKVRLLTQGSVLVSCIGNIGKVAIADSELCTNQQINAIVPNKKIVNTLFLYYSIKRIRPYLESIASSAVVPLLNKTDFSNVKIELPPLETQHKIAAILEKAEETKKLRAQADELTQQLLQSVFLEMFGDPVTNPKGLNTKKLKDLCLNIYGGGTPSKSKLEYYEGEIPWVTPKDMKQDFVFNSIDHISEDAVKNSSAKLIPSDSLLMVIRSGILKKKLPVAVNTCDVTLNQDMKGFVFNNLITNSLFMLYYFKSYQKYLLGRVRSVTADNLEFQQIKNIDVIHPQIELQNSFAAIVEKIKLTNNQQTQTSQELDTLFNALMQKAFTGELVS